MYIRRERDIGEHFIPLGKREGECGVEMVCVDNITALQRHKMGTCKISREGRKLFSMVIPSYPEEKDGEVGE